MLTKLKNTSIINQLDRQAYNQIDPETDEYIWDEVADPIWIQGFMRMDFLIQEEIGW